MNLQEVIAEGLCILFVVLEGQIYYQAAWQGPRT